MADRILTVDDDAKLCALLAEFLGAEAYEVESHNRGGGARGRVLTIGDVVLDPGARTVAKDGQPCR